MNYKAFTLILFVLIFCLSSTMASRRILSGPGRSSKMQSRSRHPRGDKSATIQQPPANICNEKVYGNCIGSRPTVRRCNSAERCTIVP
ncbi:hypothetical protein MTR67_021511 [Solanum verrucosum]|uniref:Uncharacterized protein n=1 Tax=Solanum verrucosum TaxID=315347 RepID=A0AAF0QRL4_SOLVR|nr:hypothetical protein MTR67_021511 [Solanum verrucosum]